MLTRNSFQRVVLYIFVLIAFAACQKEISTPVPGNPPPSAKKLYKVTINNVDSMVFTYNSSGRLQKLSSTDPVEEHIEFNFVYDNAGNVKELSTSAGELYKYVYENGKLRMTENYMDNVKVSENQFVWENSRISSNTVFIGTDGPNGSVVYKPTFKALYTYDAAGVMKSLSTYTINPVTQQTTLVNKRVIDQYDNNINPAVMIEAVNLLSFSEISMPHNILKESLFKEDGSLQESTENSYVFDAAKNIVSAVSTVTEPGRVPTVLNVQFSYR